MTNDLASLQAETQAAIGAAADPRALDAVRVAVLGKSGTLTALLKGLGAVATEARKERGAALNQVKAAIEAALDAHRAVVEARALDARLAAERMDVSLPPRPFAQGTAAEGGIHPIARTMEELTTLFGAMGFKVAEGPDIESDWHNFGALNIPDHHPARQDHDTFYVPAVDGRRPVLRTHTSPVQIRTMLTEAQNDLLVGKWWQLLSATVAMSIFVTALSLLTDSLRDALDPKVIH
jgi:phenylalanyl-tRNA synthetase alpha chain